VIGDKDRWRLEHIRDAVAAIRAHSQTGRRDLLTLHAVLYNIAVIGEASGQLSDEARKQADDVPWREIIGMRIIVAHQYFKVDEHTVWAVVDRHLGPLDAAVERLLAP
jgi:uncharacterized protein with HEPN domain